MRRQMSAQIFASTRFECVACVRAFIQPSIPIASHFMRTPMRANSSHDFGRRGRSLRRILRRPSQRFHTCRTVGARRCARTSGPTSCECLRARWLRSGANEEGTALQEWQRRRAAHLVVPTHHRCGRRARKRTARRAALGVNRINPEQRAFPTVRRRAHGGRR